MNTYVELRIGWRVRRAVLRGFTSGAGPPQPKNSAPRRTEQQPAVLRPSVRCPRSSPRWPRSACLPSGPLRRVPRLALWSSSSRVARVGGSLGWLGWPRVGGWSLGWWSSPLSWVVGMRTRYLQVPHIFHRDAISEQPRTLLGTGHPGRAGAAHPGLPGRRRLPASLGLRSEIPIRASARLPAPRRTDAHSIL